MPLIELRGVGKERMAFRRKMKQEFKKHPEQNPESDSLAANRHWARKFKEGMAEIKAENAAGIKRLKSYARGELKKAQRSLGREQEVKGLEELVGGRITAAGFHPAAVEGGLAIDYVKDGKAMRAVFGYTELGLWIEWIGERK